MKHFAYKKNHLCCENVRIDALAQKYGTPLYVYSKQAFIDQFQSLKNAFTKITPLICYSVKACSNVAILETLVAEGAGLDIVSGGELFRAKKAQCKASKIVFAGVGKTEAEIRDAIKTKIHFFNVESEPELRRINDIACAMNRHVNVALRLNPDVESHTHAYITTAKKENKFGIDFATAKKIFRNSKSYQNLVIKGIHLHVGSQLTQVSPFLNALEKILTFLDGQKKYVAIDTINLGGGVGIIYDKEKPIKLAEYAQKIEAILLPRGYNLILEPGRYISGNSGVFVSEVQYVKQTKAKNFIIVDGAMNDLIRPALYQAYHEIVPEHKKDRVKRCTYDIVGPICESGDFFAKERKLPQIIQGQLLVVNSAGAYGFTMSSNYNSRPRAAEILVHGSKHAVIRKKEVYGDILRGEISANHL